MSGDHDGTAERVDDVTLQEILEMIESAFLSPDGNTVLRAPLTLMEIALALMDRIGQGASAAACTLHAAVDCSRGSWTPAPTAPRR